MVAEILGRGISFIPQDNILQKLLRPEMEITVHTAQQVDRKSGEIMRHTRFCDIQSSLARYAGAIPGQFSDILGLDDTDNTMINWQERVRKVPGKRDPKLFLAYDSPDYSRQIHNVKVIHPIQNAIATIVTEQAIDTTKAGDNTVPAVIRVAGLVEHRRNGKQKVRYNRVIINEPLIELGEDDNSISTIVMTRKSVETLTNETVIDRRIIAASFNLRNRYALKTGLVSLSFYEFLALQSIVNEFGIDNAVEEFIVQLQTQGELKQTPGVITGEMVRRSDDTTGLLFHQTASGDVLFGRENGINNDNATQAQIQKAITAAGFKLQVQRGANRISISYKPQEGSTKNLSPWSIPFPIKLE